MELVPRCGAAFPRCILRLSATAAGLAARHIGRLIVNSAPPLISSHHAYYAVMHANNDDVVAELDRLRRLRDVGLKDIVNDALPRGLRDMTAAAKRTKPFRTQPLESGPLLVASIDNIAELLAEVEGEAFR